jgi:hypothetical protein
MSYKATLKRIRKGEGTDIFRDLGTLWDAVRGALGLWWEK